MAALLICISGVPTVAQIDGGTFESTDPDVVARFFHAGGMLDHGIVMISGGMGLRIFPPSLFSRDDVAFYDPASGTFSATYQPLDGGDPTRPKLRVPRSSHTQTRLPGGCILITGGHTGAHETSPGTPVADVEVFDPLTGTMQDGPPMARARAMHSATTLPDGRVVIAGGGPTWQVFDPDQQSWSPDLPLERSRTAHAAVLLPGFDGVDGDDRVLLIGGTGAGSNTIELLDPNARTGALLTSTLPVGMDDLAAVRLADGQVLIVGGQRSADGETVATTFLLDPVADTITQLDDVPDRAGGIADHEIVRFGDSVMVFGGEQEVSGQDTELDYAAIFDAPSRTWIAAGRMTYPHDDFVAVTLGRCQVLLVGGGVPFLGQELPSRNAEIFTLTLPDQCRDGDFDNDTDVDLTDHARWVECFTGPAAPPIPHNCLPGDLDHDGDIDQQDFALFTLAFDYP